tara:strand:- start:1031 stop:1420 length:390 start_codon:yes stop_codon:yes gene_type:complete
MKTKSIIIAAALAAFFSSVAQALEPYATMIPMRVLCVQGGPAPLLKQLEETFAELPRYHMEIAVQGPTPIGMIITENSHNGPPDGRGTSTILFVNSNLNTSCIFFTSKGTLKEEEFESLPAKVQGETDA